MVEMLFIEEIINRWDFDYLDHHHRKHQRYGSNRFPSVRFRPEQELWSLDTPREICGYLTQRVMEDFFEFFGEGVKEELGFEVFFDINGYNLLADIPIKDLLTEREELEDELKWNDERLSEREELEQKLIDCCHQLDKFQDFANRCISGWKEEVKEMVVVHDENGWFSIKNKDDIDEGLTIWEPNCPMCEERIEDFEDMELHKDRHIEDRDEFYEKWRESKEREKLIVAGNEPQQRKLGGG